MPMMRPPHHKGLRYAGRHIEPGADVEVAEADVAAHLGEGWLLVEPDTTDTTEDADAPDTEED